MAQSARGSGNSSNELERGERDDGEQEHNQEELAAKSTALAAGVFAAAVAVSRVRGRPLLHALQGIIRPWCLRAMDSRISNCVVNQTHLCNPAKKQK